MFKADHVLLVSSYLLTCASQTNVLLQIRGEGLADEAGEGLEESKTMYVVHPNCVVDDIGA
jgi:hypothetical protein